MAKHGRLLPARAREAVDDSVLIRSAETLGRMIGTLQRQLDGTTRRVSSALDDSDRRVPAEGNGHRESNRKTETAPTKARSRVRAAGVGRTSSGAKKTQSAADRKSKRASKSAQAKKSAGRSGSRKAAARNRR